MLKITAITLITVLALGLAAPSHAAQWSGPRNDSPSEGSGDGGGNPTLEVPSQNPDSTNTNPKRKRLFGYANERQCGEDFTQLPSIRAAAVRSVTGIVTVAPVCADANLIAQQRGVGSLRAAVNRNVAMRAALHSAGYNVDDIVGIVIENRGTVLYVHAH